MSQPAHQMGTIRSGSKASATDFAAVALREAPEVNPSAPVDPRDRLIVALDTPTANAALVLAERISGEARFFKVGIGHLGWNAVGVGSELRRRGYRLFLDLKLFDIQSVVERAVAGVIERAEPDLLTVHGDPHVVAAARRSRDGAATRILAVTVLTSLDRRDLDRMMIEPGQVQDVIRERGRRALEAGADGLIAAPPDIPALRSLPDCADRLIVTPGIRLAPEPADDQARTASAREAIRAGADYIVVGRPILNATDPVQAARSILASCSA